MKNQEKSTALLFLHTKWLRALLPFVILAFSKGLGVFSPFNTDSAYLHLREQMDKYHKTFDVYTDMDAGGNHYIPYERMQDTGRRAIYLNQACTLGMRSGITCIKCVYFADSAAWAAVGWHDSVGYNLTGAETCSFWARGENGGEILRFEVGGPYDSINRRITVALNNSWTKYCIDLRGGNLRNVKRGFCWVAERGNNPNGCVFYLDDIKFDLERLDSLRLIHTYIPLLYRHDREWALNQAYTYPNVLATFAFMQRGTPDDMRRAGIIAEAFKFCQENDRFYRDGRLRNAYMSGDIRNHKTGKARLPGWWSEDSLRWYEDRYQVGTYVGEMAWLIIAWLTYDSITRQARYLQNAVRLGNWIVDSCYDPTGPYPGYRGGFEGCEGEPPESLKLYWKSTEHNLDLYAAFTWLYNFTRNDTWLLRANRALNFVRLMWDSVSGYFRCGVKEDGSLDTLLTLDAQTWGLLVTRDSIRYGRALISAENRCRRETLGYKGFCFSERGDGIWWEGVGQMTCAYQFMSRQAKADTFFGELRRWQNLSPQGNRKGIVAAHSESSYTGIDRFWGRWYYFSRLDIGATSWYIFAENRYNPFWNETIPSSPVSERERDNPHKRIKIRNSPNPFSSKFWIYYDLPKAERVKIRIYNITGKLINTLLNEQKEAGAHFIGWNGTDEKGRKLPNGIYFISLSRDKSEVIEKIVIIR